MEYEPKKEKSNLKCLAKKNMKSPYLKLRACFIKVEMVSKRYTAKVRVYSKMQQTGVLD